MIRQRIIEIITCAFIILFVYAAMSKLLTYEKFVVQLGQSPLLTHHAQMLAWIVPGIEIVIASLLVVESLRLYALYASLGIMVMFTTYIILALNFFDYVPCSCGGILEHFSWNEHLMVNLAFVAMGIIALMLHRRSPTLNRSEVLPIR